MRRIYLFSVICYIFLAKSTLLLAQQATFREYTKTYKTYPFSDPNPIPKPATLIYPYFRFDGYTDKPVNKEWKIVELENEYIKLTILPEIGGKIWAAYDKASGKSFFYDNQVVKFRDIAMRGPWTSGGLEANYGIIGHTPAVATPVDYLVRKNEDGSVSCFIGTLDLLTQTTWCQEINVAPDKAYFTTRSFWYNSSPLEQPYYSWMNAGIKAAGNLQFIYPGTHYLGHEGQYEKWPVDEQGRDLSFYENNNFGTYKSYHVFGKYTDFFGGYWHDEDFGMGRYSTQDDKAGKKIWIWGLSREGMIWDKILTDTDGQYVEVQSGRLYNQAAPASSFTPFKNIDFSPYASEGWKEYWFPVKGTKGFVKANTYGALNLKKENNSLKIYFSPLQTISDTLKIIDNGKVIYSKVLSLKPLQLFSDSMAFTVNDKNLVASLGGNKLVYSANPQTDVLQRPMDFPKEFDWQSGYGLYIQGKELARHKQYGQALTKLQASLQKEPYYGPALVEVAQLLYRNRQYQEALTYAKQALSLNTYDPAANYLYGLANLALQKVIDAKDGFDLAALSTEYRAPAYTQLSKLYFTEKNYIQAAEYAHKSLEYNRNNLEAYQLLAVIQRLENKPKEANAYLNELAKIAPLNHFMRVEQYFLNKTEENKKQFTSLIRTELPHETYMELALWYYHQKLFSESIAVLELAPVNPETLYWQAFLHNKLTNQASGNGLVKKANSLSPAMNFPYRSESADVLEWVLSQENNWKPTYYLSLIHWNRQDTVKAKELLMACGTAPDFAPFYLTRAEFFAKNNPSQALSDFQKAEKLDSKNWRTGLLFSQFYAEQKNYTKAQQYAKRYYQLFPESYILGSQYAKTLLLTGDYKASLAILNKLNILPYEGATEGRSLYREANLMLATKALSSGNAQEAIKFITQSREWKETLGAGKPYPEDIDERMEDYMEALSHEKMGQIDKAKALYSKIVAFTKKGAPANKVFTAFALQNLGKKTEALNLLEEWVQQSPDNKLAKWCYAQFKGENPKVPAEIAENDNLRLLVAFCKSLEKV
jgi:tetratricopeptide (TPR) repeat protein